MTSGKDLEEVSSVALDVSSKTSVALTKIVFREFLGHEPVWAASEPDANEMLQEHDCALLIGDPALSLVAGARADLKVFDLAQLWNSYTGTGFVFAMWMAREAPIGIDLAGARDEGLRHIDEIIANYSDEIPLDDEEFRQYLTSSITFSVSEKLEAGMNLFFELSGKHGLIEKARQLEYV